MSLLVLMTHEEKSFTGIFSPSQGLKTFQSHSVSVSHKVGCCTRRLVGCGRHRVAPGTCNSNNDRLEQGLVQK
jgi:hypothetical protein